MWQHGYQHDALCYPILWPFHGVFTPAFTGTYFCTENLGVASDPNRAVHSYPTRNHLVSSIIFTDSFILYFQHEFTFTRYGICFGRCSRLLILWHERFDWFHWSTLNEITISKPTGHGEGLRWVLTVSFNYSNTVVYIMILMVRFSFDVNVYTRLGISPVV